MTATLLTMSLAVDVLYLKTAQLHLRLTAFFDKPQSPNYLTDLRHVYIAAAALLQHVSDMSMDQFVYVPRYIEQMMLAAGATLMKILNSFFAPHVDIVHGKTLFSRAVNHLRKLSVRSNDLPQRLAEVMAQLWSSSNAMEQKLFADDGQGGGIARVADESLQLKVRCRSSLSVLYDAIWRWRERVGQPGQDSLAQAAEHPTALPADTHARNTPQPPNGLPVGAMPAPSDNLGLGAPNALDGMDWGSPFGGNAVFDPLSWALDGNLGLGGGLFGGQDPLGTGIYQG